jgi:diguanylate cyclase
VHYSLSTAESAELLRLVLPRIATHGGAYVPTTYAVWFEYLAGLSPGLITALNERLTEAQTLSQEDIDRLYDQHLATREAQTCAQLQAGLGQMLQRLGQIATASGDGAAGYVQTLSDCRKELDSVSDAASLKRILESLTQSTETALSSASTLKQQVASTREEVQQLRNQIVTLESKANADPLTQLCNRRGFETAVAEVTRGRSGVLQGWSVLMADIDHFKMVNDSYGHLLGDQVIRAAAEVLKSGIKGRDIAARWGGEEFVVLLPETSGPGALTLADQLRRVFSKARIRRNGEAEIAASVTMSFGVAEVAAGESLEQAISRADKALYAAKASGRNCARLAAAPA